MPSTNPARTAPSARFHIDYASGKLTLLNQVSAEGEDPCYLSLVRAGKYEYLFVANYTSGNVVVFRLNAEVGSPRRQPTFTGTGNLGPNKERQEAPHPHWIAVGSSMVFVADLGLDKLLVYAFDPIRGTLSAMPKPGPRRPFIHEPLTSDPGSGPRQ